MESYDVIVAGAGPAGSSCALFLSKAGKSVLLLDRAQFPREKVCGDGISGRSVGILGELGILDSFKDVEHQDMYGVTFSSPNGTVAPISSGKAGEKPPGFVCRREVFDNVVFQHAKKAAARTIEGFFIKDLLMEGSRIVGVKGDFAGKEMEFRAPVVVGADGAAGVIARRLGSRQEDEAHQCAGLRCYYEGVEGMGDKIELHFVKEALPGYFWIFPLPDKRANVGICIMVNDVKRNKINLQKALSDVVEKNPVFKERFKNARRITEMKSWILPYASKRVKMAFDGCVLVGDAASLIDPFTGEGIGNALTSGKYASKTILKAFELNDFSEKTLSAYPEELFSNIGNEIDTNYRMQRMSKTPILLNLVIGKAKRSKEVQAVISDAILDPHNHKTLIDPMFMLRALLA
jgi:geranylgeranyl reductase family protein